MPALSREKTILLAAFAAAALSSSVFGVLAWRNTRLLRGPVAGVQLRPSAYTATAVDAPAVKIELWNAPPAQSRGRDWVYDTFTPPEIFYNARSQHFTVKPPTSVADEIPEQPFGLELVSVRPEPFRLQLIGYVGTEGDWRGTFQNLVTGEVFLAAAGRRVPNLALSIKALDVRAADVTLPQSMTTRQRVATAVVHDERTHRDVTLTHRERQFTGGLSAFVAPAGEPGTR